MKAHPIFARVYMRLARLGEERGGMAEHRQELLDGVTGAVIEIGCGNGLNFRHYPAGVTRVLAVEPEPTLRRAAVEAAASADVPIDVVDGVAERLPAADATFDVAVASLVLCSVDDQARALAEAARVLRPGGELRFYEHVRSQDRAHARWQRRIDPIWSFFGGGCHTSRDTPAAVEAAGFEPISVRRFDHRTTAFEYLVEPHVIGRARRP